MTSTVAVFVVFIILEEDVFVFPALGQIDKVVTKLKLKVSYEDDMETKDQRITMLEAAISEKDSQMSEMEEEMKSLTGRINVTEETFAVQCA